MQKLPNIDLDDETPQVDMRSLTRLGIWGGLAAAALLVVAVATHTDMGQRRLALALQGGSAPTQTAAVEEERRRSIRDAEIENRRLSDQVRNLSEDRDRLVARMTVLERNYEEVTGSITKLGTSPKPALPEMSSGPPSAAPPAAPPRPPEIAPVASVPAIVPERMPERVTPPAVQPQAAAPAAPAPPAAAPAAPAAAPAADPIEGAPARTEFGVDLGGAPSVAALRVAWDRIRRTHAVPLDGLRPVIGIRDGRGGQVELRLVVGPITNAATAAKLCAQLAAAGLSCQPTTFDGQRLALR